MWPMQMGAVTMYTVCKGLGCSLSLTPSHREPASLFIIFYVVVCCHLLDYNTNSFMHSPNWPRWSICPSEEICACLFDSSLGHGSSCTENSLPLLAHTRCPSSQCPRFRRCTDMQCRVLQDLGMRYPHPQCNLAICLGLVAASGAPICCTWGP